MHELDFSLGRAAIAYTGEKPWHGFGEVLDEKQPLNVWRVAAGLDWTVDEAAIYRARPPVFEPIPNRKVLSRSDNKEVLSVVSNRFKVVQPEQIIEFFKSLIEHNGFKMSTAGALRGGKRIWALADTGKDFEIKGDKVGAHMLLATAYDGTFATTAQFTSIRVVCNNTLQWSLDSSVGQGSIKIPHTKQFNAYDVKGELGLDEDWATFKTNVTMLTEHRVTKREAIEFFLTVCGVTEQEAADGKQLQNVKKLLSFYESGPGSQLPTAKDTAWGMVNAVTFLADHGRRAKDNGTRFDSAAFGSGNAMKKRAYAGALALVEAA